MKTMKILNTWFDGSQEDVNRGSFLGRIIDDRTSTLNCRVDHFGSTRSRRIPHLGRQYAGKLYSRIYYIR